ncbi:unnamed protein product [Citrullus colocynthis]|uniref:Uncharacterized protein n=1 Tax=Citrullus colocynthis TaxID=252529 RepID=A0ABP0Z2X8_9ROSI
MQNPISVTLLGVAMLRLAIEFEELDEEPNDLIVETDEVQRTPTTTIRRSTKTMKPLQSWKEENENASCRAFCESQEPGEQIAENGGECKMKVYNHFVVLHFCFGGGLGDPVLPRSHTGTGRQSLLTIFRGQG